MKGDEGVRSNSLFVANSFLYVIFATSGYLHFLFISIIPYIYCIIDKTIEILLDTNYLYLPLLTLLQYASMNSMIRVVEALTYTFRLLMPILE